MKVIIDFEQNDCDGKPIPSVLLEDIKCLGLAALGKDGLIFQHHGDPIVVDSAIHGLLTCMKPYIEKAQSDMT